VLRPERLEDELGRLETEWDVEVGRNELGHATNRRTPTQGELGKRLSPGPAMLLCLSSRQGRSVFE
jgi:hypothetical protein